jgi:hypothetical protein
VAWLIVSVVKPSRTFSPHMYWRITSHSTWKKKIKFTSDSYTIQEFHRNSTKWNEIKTWRTLGWSTPQPCWIVHSICKRELW